MLRQFIMLLILFICTSVVYASDSEILKKVENSARNWLALTDEGHYPDSWKKASVHFQKKQSESDWIKKANTIREPLGSMENRYIATAGYSKEPSGFPEGEYIVVQFYATFKNQALALETVTLAKENGDIWRVADYEIK